MRKGVMDMVRYENDCVGCPQDLGCSKISCPFYRVPHYYCDSCGIESDKLYHLYDEHLCESCLLKEVPIVKPDDEYYDY